MQKDKVHCITCHVGIKEAWKCSSTLSLTFALDCCEWSLPCPGCLTPRQERDQVLRLNGPLGQFGWVWKILHPLGFEPQILQPLGSHYIDKLSWLPLSPVQSTFSIWGGGFWAKKPENQHCSDRLLGRQGLWSEEVISDHRCM